MAAQTGGDSRSSVKLLEFGYFMMLELTIFSEVLEVDVIREAVEDNANVLGVRNKKERVAILSPADSYERRRAVLV